MSSVVFVRDYAQFDFDGPRLTTFVWPQVKVGRPESPGARHWGFADQGYRDALCGLIGRTVTGAADSPATGVVLRFHEDALVINPEPGDLEGPEIAILQMNDASRDWNVWQPGRGSFADRAW